VPGSATTCSTVPTISARISAIDTLLALARPPHPTRTGRHDTLERLTSFADEE
jgi:hypothetical protein